MGQTFLSLSISMTALAFLLFPVGYGTLPTHATKVYEFSSPTSLSNSDGYSQLPTIATSGRYVYVAWIDGSTPQGNWGLFFRSSTDRGFSFYDSLNLAPEDEIAYFPDIAASGKNVYAVWLKADFEPNVDSPFSGVSFRASHDGGSTFESSVNLSADIDENSELGPPQIIAINKNVYVVWSDTYHVYFRASQDGGKTFDQSIMLTSSNRHKGQIGAIEIAASGDHVYVLWQRYAGIDNNIFMRTSHDNGNHFKKALNISRNSGDAGAELPQLIASGDNVYATWQRSSSYGHSAAFAVSKDNGNSFATPIMLGGITPSTAAGPRIAVLADGDRDISQVYLIWAVFPNVQFAVSHDGGSTFDPPNTVGQFNTDFVYPQVAALRQAVIVGWTTENPDASFNTSFRTSYDKGTTFADVVEQHSNDTEIMRNMVSSNKNIYAVWEGFEIMFSWA